MNFYLVISCFRTYNRVCNFLTFPTVRMHWNMSVARHFQRLSGLEKFSHQVFSRALIYTHLTHPMRMVGSHPSGEFGLIYSFSLPSQKKECAHTVFTVISRSLLICDPHITNKQNQFLLMWDRNSTTLTFWVLMHFGRGAPCLFLKGDCHMHV